MDGKQLKNSILQWAIQGKLVPQNPKDEPAQKLLERIAAARNAGDSRHSERSEESSKGSKKTSLRGPCKATKQSKNPPSRIYRENGVWYEQIGTATPKDISDEIPFEIPENWAWCRLKNLASFLNGDRSKNYPNKSEYVSNGVAWINTGHITPAGYLSTETMNFISEEKFNSLGSGFIASGDLVYCLRGATYGKIARVEPYDRGAIASSLMIIRPVVIDVREYIFLLLRTPYAKEQLNIYANGAAQPNLAAKDIEKYFVPLPPLAEQKRIVAKLEQVLSLAEEYGAAQEQLDKLNKELPEALKKSILQEAIQGKLVPQNPKDEPASVLLAKIRKEKETLVKQGKLKKKDLEIIPIDKNETPFEIPDSWTWCRLKDIVYNHGQKTPTESFSYIDIGSIDNKRQKLNDKENIIQASDAPSRARKIVKINDILYSTVRPYLHNMCIIDREFSKEPIASTGFAVMACYECIVVKFLFYYLLSPEFDDYANDGDNAKGIAYPAINDEKLYKALIPLPPLAEQKRIVAKLEQLFKAL